VTLEELFKEEFGKAIREDQYLNVSELFTVSLFLIVKKKTANTF